MLALNDAPGQCFGIGPTGKVDQLFAEVLLEGSTGPGSAGCKFISGAVRHVAHGDGGHACILAAHAAVQRRSLSTWAKDALDGHAGVEGLDDFEAAAEVYRMCRSAGEAVRALTDCLIASVALRASLPVLHANRDLACWPATPSCGSILAGSGGTLTPLPSP